MPDKLYTLEEVADMLRVKPATLKRHIINRVLGATMIGRFYRVSEAQLRAYLERQTIQPK